MGTCATRPPENRPSKSGHSTSAQRNWPDTIGQPPKTGQGRSGIAIATCRGKLRLDLPQTAKAEVSVLLKRLISGSPHQIETSRVHGGQCRKIVTSGIIGPRNTLVDRAN